MHARVTDEDFAPQLTRTIGTRDVIEKVGTVRRSDVLLPSSPGRGGGGTNKMSPFNNAAGGREAQARQRAASRVVKNQIPDLFTTTPPSLSNEPFIRSGTPPRRGGELGLPHTIPTPTPPTPMPTRLVRGAGGLTGLLRANANTEQPLIPETRRQSSDVSVENNVEINANVIVPPPVLKTIPVTNTNDTYLTVAHNQHTISAPLVPVATPAAPPPAPTIDDILAELYERIYLEYLRTYGGSGD
jgi:hypothetical protein